MRDSFQIAKVRMEVGKAELFAFIDEGTIDWGVEIESIYSVSGTPVHNPSLCSDGLFRTGKLSTWRDLAPRRSFWVLPNDTDTVPAGMIYTTTHLPLYLSRARCFTKQGKLRIFITGRIGLMTKVKVNTEISFKGVLCGRRSEEESIAELSSVLNSSEFEFSQDENGVSIMKPKA